MACQDFFAGWQRGIFDIEDLKYRIHELPDFVKKVSRFYGFDLNKTVAVGSSNGGNHTGTEIYSANPAFVIAPISPLFLSLTFLVV
jgi:predicted esterase